MSDPLVLPVGHYAGPVTPSAGAGVAHHLVRTGLQLHRLRPGAQVDTWALAHGTGQDGEAWTLSAMQAAAAAAGVPADTELDELVAGGLVALVTPDSAAAFAAAHRLRPLLTGLGSPPGDPFEVLGIPGLPHSLRVRPRIAEVWRWVGLWPDLASASQARDRVARSSGQEPGGLAELLADVQVLLGGSAAFLDVPGGGRPFRRHDLPAV